LRLIAVLGGHPGKAADYVGHSERITEFIVPLVVVPTTAGTGSEASPDAGIDPDAKSISSGITSRHVVPRVAVCDPELTFTLPPRLTAATGMEALSHCIEGYLACALIAGLRILGVEEGLPRLPDLLAAISAVALG
jgi:4-hydroxybutyrate dehydrogenase